jgi:sulfoxide reductase heme-binding subunit YedZ
MHNSVISAYIIGVAVLLVMMILSIIVSNAIKYEPGSNPRDPQKRRTWFWIFGVATLVFTFLVGYIFVYTSIRVPSFATKYLIAMTISSVVSFVLYIAIGFILSKSSGHGKLSNWFRK